MTHASNRHASLRLGWLDRRRRQGLRRALFRRLRCRRHLGRIGRGDGQHGNEECGCASHEWRASATRAAQNCAESNCWNTPSATEASIRMAAISMSILLFAPALARWTGMLPNAITLVRAYAPNGSRAAASRCRKRAKHSRDARSVPHEIEQVQGHGDDVQHQQADHAARRVDVEFAPRERVARALGEEPGRTACGGEH